MRCKRIDCIAPAVAYPVLVLRAYPAGNPAEAMIELPICGDHAAVMVPADILTEEAWQSILDGFESQGLEAPKRSLLQMRWEYFAEGGP
jgi:hypothetical protein